MIVTRKHEVLLRGLQIAEGHGDPSQRQFPADALPRCASGRGQCPAWGVKLPGSPFWR